MEAAGLHERSLPACMKDFLDRSEVVESPESILQGTEDLPLAQGLWKVGEVLRAAARKPVEPELLRRGLKGLEVLRDSYVWENLNVGHWKTVDPVWRRLYTFFSICKVVFMSLLGEPWREVIKECDMGLLMGEPILDDLLLRFAEQIGGIIRDASPEPLSLNESEGQRMVMDLDGVALAAQNPDLKFQISTLHCPALEQFSEYLKNGQPTLIEGAMDHWPARVKWSVQYIKRIAGFRTVPVEIGSQYTSDDWTQKLMTVEEFVEQYMQNQPENVVKGSKGVGYVAQHKLFEQITELGSDIKVPDYCLLGESKEIDVNAWFGPGGTVSPTHHDPKNNILVQVFGAKLIRLYPPSESPKLSPFPPNSILFNTSQIDMRDPNLYDNHPELKTAKYCEFILKPGMMLFMPPKWWHYVQSLSPSFSISYWFE